MCKDTSAKNKRVFLLEFLPENEEEEEEQDWGFEEESNEVHTPIELTANSLAGIAGMSSIRLVGNVAGKEIGFLADRETGAWNGGGNYTAQL